MNPGEFLIYPNPTNDILHLETGNIGYYFLRITNMSGEEVFSLVTSDPMCTLNLTASQKGVYIIGIRLKDFVTRRKIIKL